MVDQPQPLDSYLTVAVTKSWVVLDIHRPFRYRTDLTQGSETPDATSEM